MSASLREILADIETNTKDGAAVLAARGLDALEIVRFNLPFDSSRAKEALFDLVRRISALRPAMGAIGVQALLACARARNLLSDGVVQSWPAALERAVREARDMLKRSDRKISTFALATIGRGRKIATCSNSSTVLSALLALEPKALFVGEGHPLGDGVCAARAFAARGFDTTLVSDGALPSAIQEADAVLIGADQVLRDGSVVNRSSSLSMALAAHHFQVPFVVVCQRIKITGFNMTEAAVEQCPDALPNAPPDVHIDAPLFDITPAALVSRLLTEYGELDGSKIKELSAATAALREEITGTRRPA